MVENPKALADKLDTEHVKLRSCFLCGALTDRYVTDVVTGKKVPLCETCFLGRVYPSKQNIQKLKFWNLIFPIVERVK